uniref:Uncharacterized protein n=1 Tax=Anguilla anguilla TaxID=7936 RepID=A0A0E9PCU5_ANGAN
MYIAPPSNNFGISSGIKWWISLVSAPALRCVHATAYRLVRIL